MIFVTVGSMFPFDRIVRAMDDWACLNSHEQVVAQIGAGGYEPKHMDWVRKMSPGEFRARVRDSSVVVAHAGMGTVITAAEFGRPIVLLPRRANLAEHTTDHQLHTANWLKDKPGIFVSVSEAELHGALARAYSADEGRRWGISNAAPAELTERVHRFVAGF